jgi:uncharacterized protein YrrD
MLRKPVKDKNGYLTILLKKNGKYKNHKVHRLVAVAFIPNNANLPQINHRDEDKTNNRVDNLEWCTPQYNNTYHGKHLAYRKRVVQLDDAGNIVAVFDSVGDAARAVGVCESCVSTVLSGRRKKTGGYRWAFQ